MADNSNKASGIGLSTLIFLTFLTFKLSGVGVVATWSWWMVTSPLWLPLVIVFGFFLFVMIINFIFSKFD